MKSGVFSEAGIHFSKAYRRLTILWPEIREVVHEHEPKVIFYRIICGTVEGEAREYILTSTQDDTAFERTLKERNIPFRMHEWLDSTQTTA